MPSPPYVLLLAPSLLTLFYRWSIGVQSLARLERRKASLHACHAIPIPLTARVAASPAIAIPTKLLSDAHNYNGSPEDAIPRLPICTGIIFKLDSRIARCQPSVVERRRKLGSYRRDLASNRS